MVHPQNRTLVKDLNSLSYESTMQLIADAINTMIHVEPKLTGMVSYAFHGRMPDKQNRSSI
jgi:hypothetical protein